MVGYIHDVPGPPPRLDLEENMPSEGWNFKNRWQIFLRNCLETRLPGRNWFLAHDRTGRTWGKKLARRTDTGEEPPFPLQLEMSLREHVWKLFSFTDLFTSLYGSSKRTYSLFVHVSVCIEYHYLSPSSSPLPYLCIVPHCSTSYLYPSLATRAFHASKSHRTLYTLTTIQFALLSLSPLFPITILSVRFDCSLYSFFFVANDCMIGSERARTIFRKWMDRGGIGQPARPNSARRLKGGRRGKREEIGGLELSSPLSFVSSQILSVTVTDTN